MSMKEWEKVQAAKEKHEFNLLSLQNVTAVGIGTKIVNGENTGELCIKVFVAKKLPLSALKAEQVVPTTLENDVKTDVEEAGPFYAMAPVDHQKKWRPPIGGISTSRVAPGTGSICGFFFKDKTDGQVVGVSNNHVWAWDLQYPSDVAGVLSFPGAEPGQAIIQPGWADGGTGDPDYKIGELKRWVPIKMTPYTGSIPKERWNRVDLAMAKPTVDVEPSFLGPGLKKLVPTGWRRMTLNDAYNHTKLLHSGRTTNISYGYVSAVNTSTWVLYGSSSRDTAFFTDQVMVGRDRDRSPQGVVQAGDSGSSMFVESTLEWAGLVFAGDSSGNGVINQPDNVLNEGNLEFYVGPPPPPPPTEKYGPCSTSIIYNVKEAPVGYRESDITLALDKGEYNIGEVISASGQLMDKETKAGLPNRTITWVDEIEASGFFSRILGGSEVIAGEVVTDANGKYAFTFMADTKGKHRLTCNFLGDQ